MTWVRVKNIFEQVVAGGLIQLPSSARDFLNPDLTPYLDRYYRGTGIDAEERVKLMKMIWDAIGTEFGGRHELYEVNYAGIMKTSVWKPCCMHKAQERQIAINP